MTYMLYNITVTIVAQKAHMLQRWDGLWKDNAGFSLFRWVGVAGGVAFGVVHGVKTTNQQHGDPPRTAKKIIFPQPSFGIC